MKKEYIFSVIFSCCVFLCIPNIAFGRDCITTLNDGYKIEDINNIFQCIDIRLQNIEADILKMQSVLPSDEKIVNPAMFDTGDFKVLVRGSSKDANSINIALLIQNKTPETILIALDRDLPPVLIDEHDGKDKPFIAQNKMPVTCGNCSNNTDKFAYSTLLPNGFISLHLKFNSDGSSEKFLLLNLTFIRLKEKNINRISSSIGFMIN